MTDNLDHEAIAARLRESQACADWCELMASIHPDSIESEDVYSMALGFLLAYGFHADRCHVLIGSYQLATA